MEKRGRQVKEAKGREERRKEKEEEDRRRRRRKGGRCDGLQDLLL